MKTYVLERIQTLPRPVNEVFPFFEAPENLGRITPPWLAFRMLTPSPVDIKQGTLIEYTIRWLGIPIRWRTLIVAYQPPGLFVDEQLKGPYSFWHHTHSFVSADVGTEMSDLVRYRLPGAILGDLLHRLFIRRQLDQNFDYRERTIAEIFASPTVLRPT
jgi:hypothetical protein